MAFAVPSAGDFVFDSGEQLDEDHGVDRLSTGHTVRVQFIIELSSIFAFSEDFFFDLKNVQMDPRREVFLLEGVSKNIYSKDF